MRSIQNEGHLHKIRILEGYPAAYEAKRYFGEVNLRLTSLPGLFRQDKLDATMNESRDVFSPITPPSSAYRLLEAMDESPARSSEMDREVRSRSSSTQPFEATGFAVAGSSRVPLSSRIANSVYSDETLKINPKKVRSSSCWLGIYCRR